jgi:hypothetical protein
MDDEDDFDEFIRGRDRRNQVKQIINEIITEIEDLFSHKKIIRILDIKFNSMQLEDRHAKDDKTHENEGKYHAKEHQAIIDEGNTKVVKMTETDRIPTRTFSELLQNKYKNPFDLEKSFVFFANALFLFTLHDKGKNDIKTGDYFNDFKVYEDKIFDEFTKGVQHKSDELQARAFWFHPQANKYTSLFVYDTVVKIWQEYEELLEQPRKTLEFYQKYVAYNWFIVLVNEKIDQRNLVYAKMSVAPQVFKLYQKLSDDFFQSIMLKIRERYTMIKTKLEGPYDEKKWMKVLIEMKRNMEGYQFKDEVKIFKKEEEV